MCEHILYFQFKRIQAALQLMSIMACSSLNTYFLKVFPEPSSSVLSVYVTRKYMLSGD